MSAELSIDTLGLPIVDSLLPSSLDELSPLLKLSSIDHPLNPNVTAHYSIEFGFERLFESREQVDTLNAWMKANWKLSFVFAALYIVLIVVGRFYMSSRPRFELRKPLLLWNLFLASFSIAGSIRTWPEFVYAVFGRGIVYSVCDISYAYSITGFWAFLFIMSKLPELVDTLFIVLRKQELIFLHYYHHATVLIYCWYSYSEFAASGRWFMCMNYVVHSIMYSYYALKAMRVPVPMSIAKLITFLQIVQMFFGCYVNWIAYTTKKHSPETPCQISDDNIFYSFLMYLSYFALFAHFFLNAYIKANARHKLKRQQMELEKKQQQQQQQANGHTVKKTN